MSNPHIPDDAPWTSARFAVLDLEGNGHQPPDLVELSVIPIDSGVPGSARTWLVQPEHSITSRVTRIHGIKNADVSDAPRFEMVSDEIEASLEGRYLVAHHAAVDWDVLHRQLPLLRPPGVLDTLRLARALCPGRDSYSLTNLLAGFDLGEILSDVEGGPHRATYDASALVQLFMYLIERTKRGKLSFRKLLALSALPTKPENQQQSLF